MSKSVPTNFADFFLKNQILDLLIFPYCFSILYFYFLSNLHYFLLLPFGLVCSPFYLRYMVRLLIWDISCLLIYVYTAIKFPLGTAFAAYHNFWYVVFLFLFVSWYILISPVISLDSLVKCMLFNFHILVIFPLYLLLFISGFAPLWSEKIVCILSSF